MRRRRLLHMLGAGSIGLWAGSRLPFSFAADPKPDIRPGRLDDLAQRLRKVPTRGALDLAADALSRGATPQDLFGAVFVAGVLDIRPRPVGNNLHVVMTVESGYRLAERLGEHESRLLALWMVDAFKRSQREEDGNEWELPPAPSVRAASSAKRAAAELRAALEAWDDEAADRAVVRLLPHCDRESLYEVLWPYSARCMANLGHKIVYGAMSEAVLRRIDWRFAEPTVRSLVYGLNNFGREGEPLDAPFVSARALAPELRDTRDGEGARDAPEESAPLARAILGRSHRDAQQAVLDALRERLHPRVVWDACRLAAAELLLRRKSDRARSGEAIRAAHAVTEIWSMAYAARCAGPATQGLLTLQAAGWLADFRQMLLDRDAISMKGPGILDRDDLEKGSAGSDPDGFVEASVNQCATRTEEYHQFKVICALAEELPRTHPRWRARIAASAERYLARSQSPVTETTRRSKAALHRAGLS